MLKVMIFRNQPAGVQASNVYKRHEIYFFNMILGYVRLSSDLTKFNNVKNFHLPP